MYILDTYKRATELGTYLVEHNSTVRATAGHFGISKSTVHKDITPEGSESRVIQGGQPGSRTEQKRASYTGRNGDTPEV